MIVDRYVFICIHADGGTESDQPSLQSRYNIGLDRKSLGPPELA